MKRIQAGVIFEFSLATSRKFRSNDEYVSNNTKGFSMASIQKLGKGKQPLRAIDFTDPLSKKRKRIRLGVVSHDFAVECKRRIERLVAAKSLNHPDPETSHWLTGIAA
ncbi:MAG: hypothetical protein O2955_20855, partial [Planctomycetota bacterium]|nr:hypothetical protein [Planctomycetota bacterium]